MRPGWMGTGLDGAGASFKNQLTQPGTWRINLLGMGECLPNEANRVTLDRARVDAWGIPTLKIDMEFKGNEPVAYPQEQNESVSSNTGTGSRPG